MRLARGAHDRNRTGQTTLALLKSAGRALDNVARKHAAIACARHCQGEERPMEFNRNHYFLAGLVVLMLGIQMRMVDSFILSSESTHFLATKFPNAKGATIAQMSGGGSSGPRKTLKPPEWLGWALISAGSVLVLHSLAMPRPA
ncbi:MAG: hypothetical protein ABUL64_02530 [Singulisphaera sp.]